MVVTDDILLSVPHPVPYSPAEQLAILRDQHIVYGLGNVGYYLFSLSYSSL